MIKKRNKEKGEKTIKKHREGYTGKRAKKNRLLARKKYEEKNLSRFRLVKKFRKF